MKQFKDRHGHDWSLDLHIAAVKRVKAALGVDLLAAMEGDLLERLANDPVLLCDVLWVLCEPDARKASISDEQFGAALAGDAIERAATAFMEELVDFFPPAKRQVLADALAKLTELQASMAQAASERIKGPTMERALQAVIARTDAEIEQKLAALGESSTG